MTARGPLRRAMERSLERPLVMFVSLLVTTVTVLVAEAADASNPLVWLGLPLYWFATALLWGATRRRGVRNAEVGMLALATVILYFTYVSQSVVHLPPGVRDAPLAAVVLLVTAFATPRIRVLLLVASIGAVLPFEIGQGGVLAATEFAAPVIASVFATYGAVRYLRASADRADVAEELLRGQLRQAAVAAERRRSQRDISGILHDHVISALREVRLATPDWHEVRVAAVDALNSLEREAPGALSGTEERVQLAPMLDEVADRNGAHFVHDGGNAAVRATLAAAVVTATGELVRNARRHARPTRVVIELKRVSDGWEVLVSDDGVGFDASDSDRYGHGLRHSVKGRMESVGAAVSVESTPGAGTVATLRLPASTTEVVVGRESGRRRADFTANMGDLARTLYLTVIPYLACTTLFAIHHQALGQPTWLLAWWGLGVVLTFAAISRVNQGIPAWLSLASAATLLAGPLAFGLLVPDVSLDNFSTWPLGGLSGLIVALYFGRPKSWESITALLGLQGLVWVPAFLGYWDGMDGIAGVLNALPSSLATFVPFVIAVVFAREINRLRKISSIAADEAEELSHLIARDLAREAIFSRRLDHVRDEVAPFLRMVAASPHSKPQWQEAATRLEQLARDELHVPGVLDSEARDALFVARAAGCAVSFHVPDVDIQNSSAARELIKMALGSSTPPREFTLAVSVSPHTGDEQFSAVTIPGDPGRAARFATRFSGMIVEFDDSPEATWIQVAPASSARKETPAA